VRSEIFQLAAHAVMTSSHPSNDAAEVSRLRASKNTFLGTIFFGVASWFYLDGAAWLFIQ
jgi:hypothetical protein